MSVTRDRFCTVGASTTVRCPEFRDVRYSGAVNILFYRTFSWYIDYCPLLGMCPLLGVSVNGESTVLWKMKMYSSYGYVGSGHQRSGSLQ